MPTPRMGREPARPAAGTAALALPVPEVWHRVPRAVRVRVARVVKVRVARAWAVRVLARAVLADGEPGTRPVRSRPCALRCGPLNPCGPPDR